MTKTTKEKLHNEAKKLAEYAARDYRPKMEDIEDAILEALQKARGDALEEAALLGDMHLSPAVSVMQTAIRALGDSQ